MYKHVLLPGIARLAHYLENVDPNHTLAKRFEFEVVEGEDEDDEQADPTYDPQKEPKEEEDDDDPEGLAEALEIEQEEDAIDCEEDEKAELQRAKEYLAQLSEEKQNYYMMLFQISNWYSW